MERPNWAAADEVDIQRPSAARVYDYWLGGAHNFAVDRELAERVVGMIPEVPLIMQSNRAFLRRAVQLLLAAGVRQFLDLGSGIPTVGNVHEIVRRESPGARVVYVDNDPIAVAHSRAIIDGDPHTTVLQADVRDPDQILTSPDVHSWLNLDEPVGVLMVAVLHFVPDEGGPAGIVTAFRDAVAPGSHLVVSHGTSAGDRELAARMAGLYRNSAAPFVPRSREQVTGLFDGFELLDPGVVFLPEWRPEPGQPDLDPQRSFAYAGVGRRP